MFYKYILTSSAINRLFGIYNTYNADVIRRTDVVNKMLLTEKMAIITIYTLSGSVIAPIQIFNLFNYLEDTNYIIIIWKILLKNQKEYMNIYHKSNNKWFEYDDFTKITYNIVR
jgi:hypothetical protein